MARYQDSYKKPQFYQLNQQKQQFLTFEYLAYSNKFL